MSQEWSNGLFGCTKHINTCLLSCFVPCAMVYYHSKAVETATNYSPNNEN